MILFRNITILFFVSLFLIRCEDEVIKKKQTTPSNATVVTDGFKLQTYKAIKIGDQFWFQENLRTNLYTSLKKTKTGYIRDSIYSYRPYSTSIAYLISSPIDTLAVQWPYNGADSLIKKYGRLYTWYAAANEKGVCPNGWHVPTEIEWDKMINVLGGDSLAGGKLKDTSSLYWERPNLYEFNSYRMDIKGTGYRSEFGSYVDQKKFAFLWSSTSDPDDKEYAICYVIYAQSKKIYKRKMYKRTAMAVRCVR